VSSPTEEDWSKFERLMMYLNDTRGLGIILRAFEGLQVFAHVDASFACHENMKGCTGSFITVGNGPVTASSRKQGLVTKSSTETELVGTSDALPQLLWTREFIYQDYMSTTALIKKGRSTSTRTRYIEISYFFIKDREDGGEVTVRQMDLRSLCRVTLSEGHEESC
jgi:hypothetical protein